MTYPIDFVIIWVDGNDKAWQQERSLFDNHSHCAEIDDSECRYRDWDNLQYWFRGVEKFCPWVNNIYFVTWGHLPQWLNVNHPKLKIVNHKDFIPREYLPTFSSHCIELNLHRIYGLSEHFVYFNDDMFIINYMRDVDFFKNGMPCDSAVMNVHCYYDGMFVMAPFRDVGVVNKYFNMKKVIKSNLTGWFNIKYGFNIFRNLYLLPCPRFPGFLQQHLPTSFLKSTFIELWEKEYDVLDQTCQHKFRAIQDVNQWLFKEWQLAKNIFYPRTLRIGKSIPLCSQIDAVCHYICKQKGKMICINDEMVDAATYLDVKRKMQTAFDTFLPYKSSYEKN